MSWAPFLGQATSTISNGWPDRRWGYIDICLLTFMTLWNHEVSPPFWTLIAPMHHWQHSKEFHLRCQNKLGFPVTYNLIWIFPIIICLLQKIITKVNQHIPLHAPPEFSLIMNRCKFFSHIYYRDRQVLQFFGGCLFTYLLKQSHRSFNVKDDYKRSFWAVRHSAEQWTGAQPTSSRVMKDLHSHHIFFELVWSDLQ